MPHKIEITDKTYDRLKEFCTLNGLKVGPYADKLIFDGLMIEMYGDVPFTNYKRNIPEESKKIVEIPVPEKLKEQEEIPPEIQKVVEEHFFEMLDNKKEGKPTQEEVLKDAGVPDKVVSKITKRRLKK